MSYYLALFFLALKATQHMIWCLFIFSLSPPLPSTRIHVLWKQGETSNQCLVDSRLLCKYLCYQSYLTDLNNLAERHSRSSSFMPTRKLLSKVRRIYCSSSVSFSLFSLCSHGAFCTHYHFGWKHFSPASCPPAAFPNSETPPNPLNSSIKTKDYFLGATSD